MFRISTQDCIGLALAIASLHAAGVVWSHYFSIAGNAVLFSSILYATRGVWNGGWSDPEQSLTSPESRTAAETSTPLARHVWVTFALGSVAVCAFQVSNTPRTVPGRFGAVPVVHDRPLTYSSSPQVTVPDVVDVVKVPDDVSARSRHRPIVIVPEKTEPSDKPTEIQPVEEPPPAQGVVNAVAPAPTVNGTNAPAVPTAPVNLRVRPSPTP